MSKGARVTLAQVCAKEGAQQDSRELYHAGTGAHRDGAGPRRVRQKVGTLSKPDARVADPEGDRCDRTLPRQRRGSYARGQTFVLDGGELVLAQTDQN